LTDDRTAAPTASANHAPPNISASAEAGSMLLLHLKD
jgi:hypothetical protein